MFTAAVVAASLMGTAIAHPGEHHDHAHVKREIELRDSLSSKAARSLGKCADTVRARTLEQRAIVRRHATAERLRMERNIASPNKPYIHRRDLATLEYFETVNHNMTGSINSSDPTTLFSANTSCILTPEITIGPYYVLGELIRSNITENQPGIPVHLEMQFIDVNSCEPVPNLLVDIWAANSTGVYSGIDTSSGQGGLNTTYLRGVQPTSSDGVAEFDTIFPGHYAGRAIHNHVVVHTNASILPNGSYAGGTVAHIGQLFFDEELRSAVEETYPYNTNTQVITSNEDDMWAPGQADNEYDPFPEFVYLSNNITDGLLMWISIGIDSAANRTSNVSYAAYLAADGGHDNPSASLGVVGVGNGTFNGTMPNGTVAATTGSVSKRAYAKAYNLRKMFAGAARGL
ncbi:aromatic compound dioxygenase [Lepidopterella palustris CBS 459.81]|uniref:Aromatic compound dioxygenase n=1 Tax=Lepidopterella palustris CBS 459.81 TaxID=1314670 RepID=A0A8E2EKS9_9PEZI|nr:aromatic compound dioxygenase [Lepidopterella palustris CBS 459.81]